jgi:hypothetical protein
MYSCVTNSIAFLPVVNNCHLAGRQSVQDVVGHELNLVVVVLQLDVLLAMSLCLELLLLQGKDGIVQDLAKRVVVEVAHGHVLVLALGLELREHLLESVLLLARAHALTEVLLLFVGFLFLVRVELNLIHKLLRVAVVGPVALLELGLDLLQVCVVFQQIAERLARLLRPVLLVVLRLRKLEFRQVFVAREALSQKGKRRVGQHTHVQVLKRWRLVRSIDDAHKSSAPKINSIKLEFLQHNMLAVLN